jgi:hypothetical protein
MYRSILTLQSVSQQQRIDQMPRESRLFKLVLSLSDPLGRKTPVADIRREKLNRNNASNCGTGSTPTFYYRVRSRAWAKSSQMSGGKASSFAVMRFIAMRLAVFTTP